MSSSLPCNIPVVLEYIAKNIALKIAFSKIDFGDIAKGKPFPAKEFKILDVGAGFGKWGFLIRDTFDVMLFQNFKKADWKINITAIEPFADCITELQDKIYNRIIKKEFFECIDEINKFDLVIFGDVIEHFEKEQAHKAIEKIFEHSDNVIISTPNGFLPQGAWAENKLEVHKSGWTINDFDRYKIKEHKVVEDTLFKDIVKKIPDFPKELQKPVSLLVVWLQK